MRTTLIAALGGIVVAGVAIGSAQAQVLHSSYVSESGALGTSVVAVPNSRIGDDPVAYVGAPLWSGGNCSGRIFGIDPAANEPLPVINCTVNEFHLGASLALDTDLLAIGANYSTCFGQEEAGLFDVFQLAESGPATRLLQQPPQQPVTPEMHYGSHVAARIITGTRIVAATRDIVSPLDVFREEEPDIWELRATLPPVPASPESTWGGIKFVYDLSGPIDLLAGAPGANDGAGGIVGWRSNDDGATFGDSWYVPLPQGLQECGSSIATASTISKTLIATLCPASGVVTLVGRDATSHTYAESGSFDYSADVTFPPRTVRFAQRFFFRHGASKEALLVALGVPESAEVGGRVYLYLVELLEGATLTAELLAEIAAPERQDGDLFGWALDISDDWLIVGAPGTGDGGGAVHLYDLEGLVSSESEALAVPFSLDAVFPNPLLGAATITLRLDQPANVVLTVYDRIGREVMRLHDGPLNAGEQQFSLVTNSLPSGIYVVRALSGGQYTSTRLTVLR